ncbi:MAG: nitrogen fixation/metabolism regulation signal transduction histidine kinase [Alteromonadaceae bacterium]|jgi:nitrogen fixation/metabolism regulation signal transduction histidine kinase
MKTKQVSVYLISAILTLAILPFFASYLLIDEIIENAISLVVKPKTEKILLNYQYDLKTLRKLAPEKEQTYKSRFNEITDELVIYQQPELVKKVLRDTYLTYYLILFIVVLLCALTAAILLSRKVASSYWHLMESDIVKAKKLQELSYFDEWQIVTGKLAHEINNPLTPIEMMVSNLSRIYMKTDPAIFKENLRVTETVVSEEIAKLKAMVSHFNQFSKLPDPILVNCNVRLYLTDFIKQYRSAWQTVSFSESHNQKNEPDIRFMVNLDTILFNQCLINIINNAVQANPKKEPLNIVITSELEFNSGLPSKVAVTIFNDGMIIKEEDKERIFKMHYSNNSCANQHSENMGIGLAIVRKIVLDHNGEIKCLSLNKGAAFKIILPLSKHYTICSKKFTGE